MSRDFRVATDTQCCQDLKIVPVLARHGAVCVLCVGFGRKGSSDSMDFRGEKSCVTSCHGITSTYKTIKKITSKRFSPNILSDR